MKSPRVCLTLVSGQVWQVGQPAATDSPDGEDDSVISSGSLTLSEAGSIGGGRLARVLLFDLHLPLHLFDVSCLPEPYQSKNNALFNPSSNIGRQNSVNSYKTSEITK
jgi:hypothetical protein